jgi:hypothetical protein
MVDIAVQEERQMSVDKGKTPTTTLMMPVGCRRKKDRKNCYAAALKTMEMFSLPNYDLPKLKGKENYSVWQKRRYLYFVREKDEDFFRPLENERWRMVVYSNEISKYISDIREFIRCYPVEKGVVVNLDADCRRVGTTNSPWTVDWHDDPEYISKAMLAMVRMFDLQMRKRGLLFAGVEAGSHTFRPSISSGFNTPILHFAPGPRNFGENLTFESSSRPGHYPEHRRTGEGLYRALSIYSRYEKDIWRKALRCPLGFLDDYGFDFVIQDHRSLDKAKDGYLRLLQKEFGYSMVMRRSYLDADGNKRQGFNQSAAASGRNRRKS